MAGFSIAGGLTKEVGILRIFISCLILGLIIGCGDAEYEKPCSTVGYSFQYSAEYETYMVIKAHSCMHEYRDGTNWYTYNYYYHNGLPCDKALLGSIERKLCEENGYFKQ